MRAARPVKRSRAGLCPGPGNSRPATMDRRSSVDGSEADTSMGSVRLSLLSISSDTAYPDWFLSERLVPPPQQHSAVPGPPTYQAVEMGGGLPLRRAPPATVWFGGQPPWDGGEAPGNRGGGSCPKPLGATNGSGSTSTSKRAWKSTGDPTNRPGRSLLRRRGGLRSHSGKMTKAQLASASVLARSGDRTACR